MSLKEMHTEQDFQTEVQEHQGYAAVLLHMPT